MRLARAPLPALILTVAATTLALFLELQNLAETEEDAHAYQSREIQEGLSALHRDLMTVNHLSGMADHADEGQEYLAARREAFSSVRWLGQVRPNEPRPRVLISSSDGRSYDPMRDAAVWDALSHLREGEVTVAIPSSHRNLASLALVLAAASPEEPALVALIDGDDLLDDSLRAMGPSLPMRLLWNDTPIGQWPRKVTTWSDITPNEAVSVAAMDFQVQFTNLGWGERLLRIPPLPFLVLLTGLATIFLSLRSKPPHTDLPRVQSPTPLPPQLPSPAAAPEVAHRTQLWRLGELAATLSHDLGQPLNVIRLTAETAADSLASSQPDPARLRRSLDIAMEQAQRAQDMLDAMVATARRPATAATAVAAVECVRRALARQLPVLRANRIRLTWHGELDLPPVRGHAHRLEAAIWHLLVNSCEALAARRLNDGGGGNLLVECRRDHDGIAIVVADDGPGFPPALRAVFSDPASHPLGGTGKGCGLGMTVALGVVAEMGGRLHITDASGGGARVVMTLPAKPPTLLLVEDESAAAAELAEGLRLRGWRVLLAHGGRPALALFRQDPADAVVTDLHMPDGDGWYLLEELRSLAPELPMIAISTADGAELRRAVAAGAALTLRKPVSVAEIAEALTEILDLS